MLQRRRATWRRCAAAPDQAGVMMSAVKPTKRGHTPWSTCSPWTCSRTPSTLRASRCCAGAPEHAGGARAGDGPIARWKGARCRVLVYPQLELGE